MSEIDSLISIAELAKLCRISTQRARKLVTARRTPAPVRIGRSIRFRASEVDTWIRLGCPARRTLEARLARSDEGTSRRSRRASAAGDSTAQRVSNTDGLEE